VRNYQNEYDGYCTAGMDCEDGKLAGHLIEQIVELRAASANRGVEIDRGGGLAEYELYQVVLRSAVEDRDSGRAGELMIAIQELLRDFPGLDEHPPRVIGA
jgi:hypothetical protein